MKPHASAFPAPAPGSVQTPAPGTANGPSVGSVCAAEVILDWDELAPPALADLVEIIERHRVVSAADVLGFIHGKLADLRAVCPGYVSFAVDGIQLSDGSPVVSKFRVYSAVTSSFEGGDPDELIRRLAVEAGGRKEAELLRHQAEELLERARQLEEGQSQLKKQSPLMG